MDFNEIFPAGLDITDAYDQLEPVAIYILGMALYALFIFKFYQFVASKDIFGLDVSKYEQARFKAARVFLHLTLYVAKYLFIFPLVAFFWFAAITIMLSFLASDQDFREILLIAMAVVGTIRICAYITEDLSRDLAKMLPFGVLAFVIIELSSFDAADSLDVLKQADDNREAILYYLGFTIALELALRVISGAIVTVKSSMTGGR
ncbi:MAG: hypothetical protein H8E48_09855 [Chloroflexi bacterium]|nr:hypothetical protein [Chloroflexota bacterium]